MYIKKCLIILFCFMPIYSIAQFKDNDILVSCGLGYSESTSYSGISSNKQMNLFLILQNVYIDGALNFESSEEYEYGSGGISDKHRLLNFNIGYSLPIFRKYIYIVPLIGIGLNQTLYNDRYYNSDVATQKSSFCYGVNIAFSYKHIIAILKLANGQKGVSVGFKL